MFDRFSSRPARILPLLGAVGMGALLAAAPASGQEATVYAVGALDGYDTGLALVGTSIRPGGRGLTPVVSLQTYVLTYGAGETTNTVWSIGPAVGLGYRTGMGSVEGKVGYSFQTRSEEGPEPIAVGEAGGGGFSTSLSAQYWGGGPELQGIASYGWGSEYLWSQAQGTLPVVRMAGGGSLGVGAEAIYEGKMGGDDHDHAGGIDHVHGDQYRAVSFGPVAKWANGRNLAVTASGGWKDANSPDMESTWYARLSFARYGIGLRF